MDLNELTPELFEKAEFTERRRGYDIDQVERFLEETGTAVAQLLVRHRQLEERAVQAETRLGAAEQELQQRVAPVAAQAPATPTESPEEEAAEIEHATSTLLMAKRTADATISEAETAAAQARSEAAASAERIVSEAQQEAEVELAAGREQLLTVVTALEARRDALGGVVEGFEQRITSYRDQLNEVAAGLVGMTEDPEALAPRGEVHVGEQAAGYVTDDESLVPPSSPPVAGGEVDLTDATQLHDTATEARSAGGWSEGSWSEAQTGAGESSSAASPEASVPQAASPTVEALGRDSGVVVDAEPVTGQTSDRFLRELDEAVNESQQGNEGEDAMSAFFEGGDSGEEQSRSRFGWRR